MEPYRQGLYEHDLATGTPGLKPEEIDRLKLRAAHLQKLIRHHFPPDKDAAPGSLAPGGVGDPGGPGSPR
jgi:hypothetical protein